MFEDGEDKEENVNKTSVNTPENVNKVESLNKNVNKLNVNSKGKGQLSMDSWFKQRSIEESS